MVIIVSGAMSNPPHRQPLDYEFVSEDSSRNDQMSSAETDQEGRQEGRAASQITEDT